MIIAEFSHNHGGNLDRLLFMVEQAAKAGASFCKIQTFFADDLMEAWDATYETVKKNELDWEMHKKFADCCKRNGAIPMTTVYGKKYALEVSEAGIQWIKIGSPQAGNLELIAFYKMAGFKVVVSTGGHELKFLPKLVPIDGALHCVSLYPAKPNQANMARMLEMKKQYPNSPIGFSSHIDPLDKDWDLPLKLASYLGANFIEVHFTTRPREETKDGAVSLNEEQLREICHFDKLSKEEKLARYPWFGMFQCDQTQPEFELIEKYKGRWQCV